MKFLVDECIGPTVAQWLKNNKYDAISIYDINPGTDDNSVLSKAVSEDRILITNDKDFGEMVFKNKMQHSGIVLFRLIDVRPAHTIEVLEDLLKNYKNKLYGNFVVATEKTIRIIEPQNFS